MKEVPIQPPSNLDHGALRSSGLGNFATLPDDALFSFLLTLKIGDLLRLSETSSIFYVFCNEDPLWKPICLEKFAGDLNFQGTWKSTAIFSSASAKKSVPVVQKEDFTPQQTNLTVPVKGFYSDYLYSKWYYSHLDLKPFGMDTNQIDRLHVNELTKQDFVDKYDVPCKPVMLKGITDNWTANSNWTKESLKEKYGSVEFRISHRENQRVCLKLDDYMRYSDLQHDEIPLYVFDAVFGEHAPDMLKDYSVHHFFDEDYLELLGDIRPNYRWFVMGPARSGSPWHIDPHGTSAWNSLLSGRKRWALYPPDVVPPGVTSYISRKGKQRVSSPFPSEWFFGIYPYLEPEDKPIEITQEPGETIFVPRGWWHCVLNIEDTVAVTQNFINRQNLVDACESLLQDGRSDDYGVLKKKLVAKFPDFEDLFIGVESRVEQDFDPDEKRYKEFDYFKAVSEVCAKFKIPLPQSPKDIKSASAETNLVFIYNQLVFKFYRNPKNGEESFQRECELFEVLLDSQRSGLSSATTLLCPTLKCKGRVNEQDDLKWKWPFIVTNQLAGSQVAQLYADLSQADMMNIAKSLAPILGEFHQIPWKNLKSFDVSQFESFLEYQRKFCVKRHQQFGTVTFDMAKAADSFLPSLDEIKKLVSRDRFCLLHGDVTDENVLVSRPKKAEADGTAVITGLIDFGDAMIADPMYELVALFISLFRCDKSLLNAFLDGYGRERFPLLKDPPKFREVAMCYTLLHSCDAVRSVYHWKPNLRKFRDWSSFGEALWNLEDV